MPKETLKSAGVMGIRTRVPIARTYPLKHNLFLSSVYAQAPLDFDNLPNIITFEIDRAACTGHPSIYSILRQKLIFEGR